MSEKTKAAMREALIWEHRLINQIHALQCTPALRSTLMTIATIHEPTERYDWEGAWCSKCPQTRYPCKTVEALDEGTRG